MRQSVHFCGIALVMLVLSMGELGPHCLVPRLHPDGNACPAQSVQERASSGPHNDRGNSTEEPLAVAAAPAGSPFLYSRTESESMSPWRCELFAPALAFGGASSSLLFSSRVPSLPGGTSILPISLRQIPLLI